MQVTLEKLVQVLLDKKPDDPVSSFTFLTIIKIPHMVQFLQDLQGKGAAPLSKEEQLELLELRSAH